ncbi:MAG: TIGR04282 family arsenosugar biosynthesis glycosyltransferase [Bacteroidia bacterium]|nr:TIGR04282 family arsenosugar biosynthesis glycosyltransferase [Bacteroidia bacterium]
MSDNRLLLIFVKHPEPGKVKTRLAEGMGEKKALEIYEKLLEYTCEITRKVDAEKVIFYGNDIPLTDRWSEEGYTRMAQDGPNLGARMQEAFRWGWRQGFSKIIIIGSDCPGLTRRKLEDAFSHLDSYTTVLGPAKDGGYYLLGMNRPFPAIFQNKNWSTDTVLQDSLADLRIANRSFFLLPELSDVDTKDDLKGTFLEKYLED